MAHTNIDLDEKLLNEAMELTRARTKKEVIHLGLRELIRLAWLRGVREHRGKFHWRGDLAKMRRKKRMNGESPLVDTSVLIDYFEGIDCRESAVLDKLLGKIWPGFSRYISGKSILSLPYFYDAIRRFREMDISSNLSYEGTKRRIGRRKTR
jgi:Arc/MetJ family transcription regulator